MIDDGGTKSLTDAPAVLTGTPPPAAAWEPPVDGEVRTWLLDTSLGAVAGWRVDGRLLGAGPGTGPLDEGERAKARRFFRAEDRHRYLAAHLGLRALLAGYLGTDPGQVRLMREPCPGCGGPHGRPALAPGQLRGGAPAPQLHFSLSHSGDLALLVFATRPVGADVEALPEPVALHEVLGSLHPAEAAELRALPAGERQRAFTRVWTRKEAYLKGTGVGLAEGAAEPYVGSGPYPAADLPGWYLSDVPVGAGYAAAFAVRAA
ncbi:4'-phosphopantetheinyl transferase family protein [Streptomyces sp. NPDC006879]|uniref:4'-phosphopantetheinyl transferase family protein n=1 Tax=Streptomyces sp. NPDC006879 TaxID=3364767 RepID=UPI0036CB627E